MQFCAEANEEAAAGGKRPRFKKKLRAVCFRNRFADEEPEAEPFLFVRSKRLVEAASASGEMTSPSFSTRISARFFVASDQDATMSTVTRTGACGFVPDGPTKLRRCFCKFVRSFSVDSREVA